MSTNDPYGPLIQSAAQQAGVDPFVLRGLLQSESNMDPGAVSKDKGGNPIAYGIAQFTPGTAKAMGLSNPMDPTQAIPAAAKLLRQNLDQTGGNVAQAIATYKAGTDQSSWGPVTVSGTKKAIDYADQARGQSAAAQDPVLGFMSQQSAPVKGGSTPAAAQPQAGTQQSASSDPVLSFMNGQQPPAQPQQSDQQAQQQQPQPETNALSQFGHAAAGLTDTVLSAPGQLAQSGDYALRRAFQQNPEQAQQAAASDFGGASHPVGNLFDVTNTAGYQNEASQKLSQLAGGAINKGATAVANATGLPQQDVSNMASSLSLLAPGAVKAVAPIARDVAGVAGEAAEQTAADDASVRPTAPSAPPTGPAMQPRPVVGGGAATVNANPYPVLTGEETARGPFPQIKTSKIAQDVTPEEQAVRASIANEIMGDDAGAVRTGVITGNENTLRDEYSAAKSPIQTPASQAMKAQISNEQEALSQYAQDRVDATGANQNILNNEERGRVINDAIYGPEDSLTSYLQNTKRMIYDQARETAGDNPIQTSHVDTLVADPQFQAGVRLSGNEGTLGGASDLIQLARTTGFRDPMTGDMYAPNSVAAWDAVRKSINSEWSPSNRNVVRQINGAIDQDIASAGGQEMYKLGDRIHQVEQTLLDSKGIGSVLGEYDDNGVKTGASLESIPQKLNNMPLDQWQHIHDTLDDLSRGQIRGAPSGMPPVPEEVQQAAAQARNEMHGALARSVYEAGAAKAGVWNQNAVNKMLNSSVGQKITRNFSPDEVQAFHTLNYGGQIMPGVHSYEGAGMQLSRLAKPGFVEKYAPSVGVNVGHTVGAVTGIPGARWIGSLFGERAGRKLSDLAETRRGRQQYSSVVNEMRRNSRLGNP